ncbi:hypothetical protein RAD15_08790 [Bradyrhizobium sp. 14AA]
MGEQLTTYEVLKDEVRAQSSSHIFMLVDLADSTSFKTKHQEIEWLARLKRFYDTVSELTASLGRRKLLGDGVLISVINKESSPSEVISIAQGIIDRLHETSTKLFRGDHKLVARIILNYGPAFFFEEDDPQGTVIDKLFRMEKFVPNGCIGATEEFAEFANRKERPVARFPLKGLPDPPHHGLILLPPVPEQRKIADLEVKSLASLLWSFPDIEPLNLVGGYIRTEDFHHVHVGDMNAKINALHAVAHNSVTNSSNVCICDSSEFRDAAYRQNIISIGGPCFNEITGRLMDGLRLTFLDTSDELDLTPLLDERENRQFCAERTAGALTKDWGLFMSRQNPANPNCRIVVACGIESPAVDGIVRAFSPITNPNFLDLMKGVVSGRGDVGDRLPDFYCVMPFSVEANGHAQLPSMREQTNYIRPL